MYLMCYELFNVCNDEPISMIRQTLLFFACLTLTAPAYAASSDMHENPGGSVKLVTSGVSDRHGRLRGALQIQLQPGWKTYWRDPGATGIPPQIEIIGKEIKTVELFYPAPKRFMDSYGDWPGYGKSITLPIIFHTPSPGTAPLVDVEVFLGICKTVCIPVQASFTFDASAGADNQRDAWTVQSAFAALPDEPRPEFRLSRVEAENDTIILHALLPEPEGKVELFLATSDGGQIALPDLVEQGPDDAIFSARLIARPPPGADLHYTLVQGDVAVSGTILFPEDNQSTEERTDLWPR